MSHLETLRNVAARQNWIVLDTETTGLDDHAQIVQIAIVNSEGETLIDTLVHPTGRIPAGATQIHGITNEMVSNAPTWIDVSEKVRAVVLGRDVIIYNSEYDTRLIRQTCAAHGLPYSKYGASTLTCAMKAYAEYFGDWNDQKNDYSYQKLARACIQQQLTVPKAHSALGDCLSTRLLVKRMLEAKRS